MGNMMRVLAFMIVYLVIGHWAACLYIYVGKWQVANAAGGWVNSRVGLFPWLRVYCLQLADPASLYVSALYWALTTMFTVGYGDIVAATNLERCYTIFIMLVAGILQGIVFGNIGVALYAFDHTNHALRTQLGVVRALQTHHSMPAPLIRRLRDAARYSWRQAQGFDTPSFMSDLAGSLRGDVYTAMANAPTLLRAPIFASAPPGFVRRLMERLRLQVFLPGDCIADAGDPGSELFLVAEGAVRCSPPSNDGSGEEAQPPQAGPFELLREGAMFGEAETILCERHTLRYEAEGYVTLYSLSRGDLDAVLCDFPELVGPLTSFCMAHEAAAATRLSVVERDGRAEEEEKARRVLSRVDTVRLAVDHSAEGAHGGHWHGAGGHPPHLPESGRPRSGRGTEKAAAEEEATLRLDARMAERLRVAMECIEALNRDSMTAISRLAAAAQSSAAQAGL